jgi:D-alanyl-D-alanine carboxypeptidase/D-alanyl-D-alanine-endopeptidase (penicillin-binding protein 4)
VPASRPFLLALAAVALAAPATAQTRTAAPKRQPPRRVVQPVLAITQPTHRDSLATDIGSVLTRSVRSGRWGVLVTSLTRGDTLYARDADDLFLPASTMKLFTATLALDALGPAHHLTTDVLRTGRVGADGTLHGALVLRGGGDPSLSARFLGHSPDQMMDALAAQVWDAGVRRVDGDLVGDPTRFDGGPIPEGWRSRYLHLSYAARVSALSFNGNVATVAVRPDGARAHAELRPAAAVPIENTVRVRAGSRGAAVSVRLRPTGVIAVSGWIGARSGPRTYQLVVPEPERYTLAAFKAALERRGVAVSGALVVGPAPAAGAVIASHRSPAVGELVTVMNKESDNHVAEQLFRAAGWSAVGHGSADSANAALRRLLAERAAVPPSQVYAKDGSGLSTMDRVSPRALVHLLDYAHRAPWAPVFHASLPIAGQGGSRDDGTLRHRMRATDAQGNLRAKTGTTNDVASLAGYVTARNGELLAFAFLYNGNDRTRARAAMDVMGPTLAGFSRE